jgi:hypothetical protein
MLSQDQNEFLSGLSPKSQYFLASHSVAVSLPLQTVLYEANIAPPFAYFLTSGLASVVVSMIGGEASEVGMIGREGVVGAIHLLGNSRSRPIASNWRGNGRFALLLSLRRADTESPSLKRFKERSRRKRD